METTSTTQTSLTQEEETPGVVIDVNHVSVVFNIANEKIQSLKEYFIKAAKHELMFREFVAVDDVSFQVRRGDVLGLVGTNGSGKSTMLKVIAGVLEPTRGTCTVDGSISPLIELGAGFDYELTARENIYLNGALLGYSKKFLDEHIDEIIDFAELHNFMEMPIKNYSSGMVARIAFAIATIMVPDVLIVDEALSVGDVFFQEKCERRINSLIKDHGTTVLFVSHSIEQVERICNRAVWIEKGHKIMEGPVEEVCQTYRNMEYVEFMEQNGVMDKHDSGEFDPAASATIDMLADVLWRLSGRPGDSALSWLVETFPTPDDAQSLSPNAFASREYTCYALYRFACSRRSDVSEDHSTSLAVYSDEEDASGWAREALCWFVAKGYLVGGKAQTGSMVIEPRSPITRIGLAKLVTKIYQSTLNYPSDVCPTAPFAARGYFDYAITKGLMGGYASGLFGPDDAATRAQVCIVAHRLAGSPASGKPLAFDDIDKDSYAYDAAVWAAANGIANLLGCGSSFDIDRPVSADEAASAFAHLAHILSSCHEDEVVLDLRRTMAEVAPKSSSDMATRAMLAACTTRTQKIVEGESTSSGC